MFGFNIATAKPVAYKTFPMPRHVRIRLLASDRMQSTQESVYEQSSGIMPLISIHHPRYKLVVPIILEIQHFNNEYIIKYPLIDIFESGEDASEAIKDFGFLLGDYYESLLKNEESLAINLREELKILRKILETK